MKTNVLSIAIMAFATISGTAANSADMPMGVEVVERDGVTLVREVPHEHLGLEKRCRECVHVGENCRIGDGSCYAAEHASCTWCGDHCQSICVPDGETCEDWCL